MWRQINPSPMVVSCKREKWKFLLLTTSHLLKSITTTERSDQKCCFSRNKVFMDPDWVDLWLKKDKNPLLHSFSWDYWVGPPFCDYATTIHTFTRTTPSIVWYLWCSRAAQSSHLGFSCKQENKAINFSASHRLRPRRNLIIESLQDDLSELREPGFCVLEGVFVKTEISQTCCWFLV